MQIHNGSEIHEGSGEGETGAAQRGAMAVVLGTASNERAGDQSVLPERPEANFPQLADKMQAARHFVERAFEDAKGACGMADYQVRGFHAWHHHMALVMVALMFLAKERLANRETSNLLSCNDLVEIMRHKLPSKIESDADLVAAIEERHRRRQIAKDFAYRKQASNLSASSCKGT